MPGERGKSEEEGGARPERTNFSKYILLALTNCIPVGFRPALLKLHTYFYSPVNVVCVKIQSQLACEDGNLAAAVCLRRGALPLARRIPHELFILFARQQQQHSAQRTSTVDSRFFLTLGNVPQEPNGFDQFSILDSILSRCRQVLVPILHDKYVPSGRWLVESSSPFRPLVCARVVLRRRKTHHHQRVQRATRFFSRWIQRLHNQGLRLHMVATSRRRLFGFAVRVRFPPRGKSGEASTAERDRAETDVVRRREPLGMQEINRRTARMAKCT